MNLAKILIVEDDNNIAEILKINLDHAGIFSYIAKDTKQARLILQSYKINIIILDWMLPHQSGISFIKELKNNILTKDITIIMLSARTSEEDMINGLDCGADDYITKPFSPKKIVAKIKSELRRLGLNNIISLNHININPITKQSYIFYNENSTKYPIDLSPTEFKLLYFLMMHPNRVYSREELLSYVWNDNIGDIDNRTVDVQIKRLRQAIAAADIYHKCIHSIQTVRGFGYKFNYTPPPP